MKTWIRNTAIMFALTVTAVQAELTNSLSRFGKPKYGLDFTAFSYVNPNAPKGGKLKMGAMGTFDSLNQYIAIGIPPVVVSFQQSGSLTIDSLMTRSADEPYTMYALIAEKVDLAPDNSSVTFYINPKARFHDGTPIMAEDVKFSYELLREQGLPRYRLHYGKIEKMEILAPRTIKLTFKITENGYDPETPMIVSGLNVFSKAKYEGKDFRTTGMTPILGSGPYRVAKAEPGRSIVYERVKDYWGEDLPVNKGKYNFDIIQLDFYKNAEAQFQAFKAGEFDAFFEVNSQQWRDGYNTPAVRSGKIKKFEAMHQRPVTVRTSIFNMRRPIFQDIRVREAIALAYDWETVNKMLCNSDYHRATSLFANTPLAHKGAAQGLELTYLEPYRDTIPKDIVEFGFVAPTTKGDGDARANLEKADKLLNEAGWIVVTEKDPITQQNVVRRVNKDTKEPLVFEYMYKDPRLEKFMNTFRQNLQQLGITLKLRFMDTVQYEARVIESDFDMITHYWTNSLSPGNEQVYYFSQNTADQKGSSNYIGVKDPVLEALAKKVVGAKTEEEQRAAVHALDRVMMGRHYLIPNFYDNIIYFAYWADRVEFPEFNPVVGTNSLEWWWSKPSTSKGADTEVAQEVLESKPSLFARLVAWTKSKIVG
ncbi:MAG: extracellular solute-binding protein [Alphaproteobacteria bacterium]|jgi:microcin C transport system substrate-binding protein|nr:extracellular solute-binding protein [Alphaproteobacteria bacterium]